MSKVLIISDSHGLTKELEIIRERHLSEVDLMIHCGDSQLMPTDKSISGYLTVMGNCDFGAEYPLETTTEVAGRKFFITHGHRYSVKSTLMNLKYKAEEVHANIVCFGHSHVLGAEVVGGTLFINPGSIRLPRERLEKTYVILDLQSDKINMSVFESSGRELTKLAQEFTL
ncbi:YfcE family phosphodiesterase [Bacillus sp. AFS076308]|uniref:metallophosphoesterase family protein n=1 Tax=unclassified Bacillus (in: firmicutes) TaxID=185979 RepID=UPI000BF3FCBC|nr:MULTISPECIES: metallophosphoesterase [unclassified Bacillus (in: firmicutes)]PFO10228.1 YfcE family phosphodiesterase [Bacillus sp. AFS076308]PGV48569.1 YfcE family phosphodiesterase [Bacillus sp. AFS037270]